MKTLLSALITIISALSIAHAYAFVPCNGDSNTTVICYNFTGTQPAVLKFTMNNKTLGEVGIFHSKDDLFFENQNINHAVKMGYLNLNQQNTLTLTCQNGDSCLKSGNKDTFTFTLTKDKKGNYLASPTGEHTVLLKQVVPESTELNDDSRTQSRSTF